MVYKRRVYTPQDYIHVGMAFFLISFIANMVVDGRMIASLMTSVFPGKSLDVLRDIAAGFSIPILCASIFFNLRGLCKYQYQ